MIKKCQEKTPEFPLEVKVQLSFQVYHHHWIKLSHDLVDIIQYSYFLMNTYPHLSCLGISKLIGKDVIDIWKAVNPRLPLLKEISVVNKVKILCFQKAKQISRKHLPAAQTKFWKEKLDTFFDISSCSCNLPILSCDNINVKCTKENCQTKHNHLHLSSDKKANKKV